MEIIALMPLPALYAAPSPAAVSVSASSSTINRPPPRRRATIFITSNAVEFLSQSAPATVLRNHPGTFHVWRIMAHVLIVAAFQLRHPVTFFIQTKSSDLSLHCRRSPQPAPSPAGFSVSVSSSTISQP